MRHLAKHVSLDSYEQRLEHCRFYGIITLLTLNTATGAQISVGPGLNDLERRKYPKNIPCGLAARIAGSDQQAGAQRRHGKDVA